MENKKLLASVCLYVQHLFLCIHYILCDVILCDRVYCTEYKCIIQIFQRSILFLVWTNLLHQQRISKVLHSLNNLLKYTFSLIITIKPHNPRKKNTLPLMFLEQFSVLCYFLYDTAPNIFPPEFSEICFFGFRVQHRCLIFSLQMSAGSTHAETAVL